MLEQGFELSSNMLCDMLAKAHLGWSGGQTPDGEGEKARKQWRGSYSIAEEWCHGLVPNGSSGGGSLLELVILTTVSYFQGIEPKLPECILLHECFVLALNQDLTHTI